MHIQSTQLPTPNQQRTFQALPDSPIESRPFLIYASGRGSGPKVGFASIEPSTADPAGPMEARRLSTQMRPISLEALSENPSRLRRSAVMAVFRSQVAGSSV